MTRLLFKIFLLTIPSLLLAIPIPSNAELCPMGVTMESIQSQDPPQEGNPTHERPTEFCTPHNRPDGKAPCMCLMKNPEGCKQGHRETETSMCNSWCYKELCHCCAS